MFLMLQYITLLILILSSSNRHVDKDSDGFVGFKDFENVISYGQANS